jgi:hypothetical protein
MSSLRPKRRPGGPAMQPITSVGFHSRANIRDGPEPVIPGAAGSFDLQLTRWVHNQPFAPHIWGLDQTRFTPLGAESP